MLRTRKLLIFLLSLILIVPLVTSCYPEEDDNTSDENISDTESKAEADPSVKAAIDAMYTCEASRKGERIAVTQNKSYTTSIPSGQDKSWLDNRNMLTDGIYGTTDIFKTPAAWTGFVQNGLDVIVELGEEVEDICEFETTHVLIADYAINKIPGASVYASSDGEKYNFVGSMVLTDNVKEGKLYKYSLSLKEGIKATHIKFSFKGTGGWSFIDEVAAFKYDGAETKDEEFSTLYPDCKMPEKVKTEELWQSSEPDYNKKQNMLLELQPQIFSSVQIKNEHIKLNSPFDCGLLTDGKYASSNSFDQPEYFHFTRGIERTLVFDLTKTSAVSDYKFSFCHNKSAAVNLPITITVFVSENGENWYKIKRITGSEDSEDNQKCVIEGNFDNSYKARFVAVTMSVHTHLYCDEIEITGKKNISGAATASENKRATTVWPNKYTSPDDLSDVHDVVLMYNARNIEGQETEDLSKGLITEEESLRYVAYHDKDGNIKDYMFDSYLYLPFGVFDHSTADGWHKYMENTFTQGYNIDALNTAVGKANEALGNSDYKAKVFLSILRPNLNYDDNGNLVEFGDIDGDGVNEDFTKVSDRIKCIKWMIDENLRLFEEGNYENLELVGLYWYEEQISYHDNQELDMIEYTVDYVHDLGYPIIWIPYFKSVGYYDWNAVEFDVACMQPNYFWKGYGNFIEDNAKITKNLGMCVEFEVDSAALKSNFFRKNYKKYLKGGVEYGYMKDTIHMYYMCGGYGAMYSASKSKDSLDRSIYDDTYKFIKGTLSIDTPEEPKVETFTCGVNDELKEKIEISGENTYLALAYSPKYGSFNFKNNGTFTYTPIENFGGEDSFYIYSCNDYNESEIVKVTINVE